MDPSSAYDIEAVGFESVTSGEQGSKLTVNNPQADTTYTCRVTQNNDPTDKADTTVTLNVYGAYLYSSNHLHNFKSWKAYMAIQKTTLMQVFTSS